MPTMERKRNLTMGTWHLLGWDSNICWDLILKETILIGTCYSMERWMRGRWKSSLTRVRDAINRHMHMLLDCFKLDKESRFLLEYPLISCSHHFKPQASPPSLNTSNFYYCMSLPWRRGINLFQSDPIQPISLPAPKKQSLLQEGSSKSPNKLQWLRVNRLYSLKGCKECLDCQ